MQVQNGEHVDALILRMEVHAIGKVPEQRTVHLIAYSDPSRPLIPTQVGHPFRRNAATDSDVKPATISSLLGIGGRHPSE